MKRIIKRIISYLFAAAGPLLVVVLTVVVLAQTAKVDSTSGEEGMKILENSLHKAVISCYATEGVYPPSVAYIEENYGVIIDYEKYNVYYSIFADNIMPDVTVVKLPDEQ